MSEYEGQGLKKYVDFFSKKQDQSLRKLEQILSTILSNKNICVTH